jgi:anti-anti-sigma factor
VTEPSYQIAREAGHVRLSGEFDITARDDLRDEVVRAIQHDGGNGVVIDLAGTDFMDSEAMGALLDGLIAGREAGVTISIVNARGLVHRVLEVSGVLDLFNA